MFTRLKAAGNRAFNRLVEARQEQADKMIERLKPVNRDLRDRF